MALEQVAEVFRRHAESLKITMPAAVLAQRCVSLIDMEHLPRGLSYVDIAELVCSEASGKSLKYPERYLEAAFKGKAQRHAEKAERSKRNGLENEFLKNAERERQEADREIAAMDEGRHARVAAIEHWRNNRARGAPVPFWALNGHDSPEAYAENQKAGEARDKARREGERRAIEEKAKELGESSLAALLLKQVQAHEEQAGGSEVTPLFAEHDDEPTEFEPAFVDAEDWQPFNDEVEPWPG